MSKHDKTRQMIDKLETVDYIASHLSDYDRNVVVIAQATALANALAELNLAMDPYNPGNESIENWREAARNAWNHLNAAIEVTWLEQAETAQLSWLKNWRANLEKCLTPAPVPAPEHKQETPDYFQKTEETTGPQLSYKWETKPGETLKEEDDELLRPFFPELEEDTQDDEQ